MTVPIKENRDFKRIYAKGKSCVGRCVVVYLLRNRLGYNRMGITVSKKLGGAVQRNRVKRIIREAYRQMESGIAQGYDFVIVSRSRSVKAKMQDIRAELSRVLQGAGIFHL